MKPPALIVASLLLALAPPALAAPVSMEGLVLKALEQSPALQAARATATAQAEAEGVARSGYWPQVNLSAGLSQTTSVSTAQTSAQAFNLGSTSVSVRQPLWTFGKLDAAQLQAEAQTANALALADLRAVEVAYGVRQTYLSWVQATGLETQAAEQVRLAETMVKEARARVKAGVSAKLDQTRAEATLAQAKASHAGAKATMAQARRSVSAAVGQTDLIAGEPVFPASLAPQPLGELEAMAEGHPTLKTAQAQVMQAEGSRRAAQTGRNPDLSADASYGLRARDLLGAPNWQAGLSFNWPLFAPAVSSQVRAAEGQEIAVKATREARRIEILRDVDNAYLALEGAKERIPAAQAALEAARANQAQAQGRYRAGVGSIIEVADAQSLIATAHADWIRAQTSYHLAIADLKRAMGVTGASR